MRGGAASECLRSYKQGLPGVGLEAQPAEHLGVYRMKTKDVDSRSTGERMAWEERL